MFGFDGFTASNRLDLFAPLFGSSQKVEDKIHIATELYGEEVGLPRAGKELA